MVIGISDITSSEGKLERFTQICELIGLEKRLTIKRAEELIEKRIGSPFHNRKVTQRHLVILEKIGLIEKIGEIYILSSEGKALYELVRKLSRTDGLSFEEKIFYFKTLFTSILKNQLIKFLEVIRDHEGEERKKIIGFFFRTELARNLWSETVIKRNLIRLESGKIPTFFQNKFGCMEMWLRDLDLVKKLKEKMELEAGTKMFLAKIAKENNLKDKIYELTRIALACEAMPFDYIKHKDDFLRVFKEAYSLFETRTEISDIRSIRTFVCIDLLTRKIKMEEEEFYIAVKKLWKEGIIRSVMLGRNGKPAYVVLSKPI
jgi:hypothetical protein